MESIGDCALPDGSRAWVTEIPPANSTDPIACRAPVERRASRLVRQGVAVVTAVHDGIAHGMTVSSLTVLGSDPTIIAFAVRATGSMHAILTRTSGFAVTLLADHQEFTARFFASRRRPAGTNLFAGTANRPGPSSGAPMLTDALGWLDCRRVATLPLDSRTLIIGVALYDVSAGVTAGPLLHGDGRYHRLESPPPAVRTDHVGRPKSLCPQSEHRKGVTS